MNNVQLIGRITKDIELKQTKTGKAYCNFTLAISREFNKEETDFINCIAWEKKAETNKKGRSIRIRIETDEQIEGEINMKKIKKEDPLE